MTSEWTVPLERIERSIILVRGHRVMLDKDLADMYGVSAGNLNKAVNRNIDRSTTNQGRGGLFKLQNWNLKAGREIGISAYALKERAMAISYIPLVATISQY